MADVVNGSPSRTGTDRPPPNWCSGPASRSPAGPGRARAGQGGADREGQARRHRVGLFGGGGVLALYGVGALIATADHAAGPGAAGLGGRADRGGRALRSSPASWPWSARSRSARRSRRCREATVRSVRADVDTVDRRGEGQGTGMSDRNGRRRQADAEALREEIRRTRAELGETWRRWRPRPTSRPGEGLAPSQAKAADAASRPRRPWPGCAGRRRRRPRRARGRQAHGDGRGAVAAQPGAVRRCSRPVRWPP